MNDVEDLNNATEREGEEKRKAQALAILKLRRFPNGNPGTIITRAGRKYLVTESGAQRRIE